MDGKSKERITRRGVFRLVGNAAKYTPFVLLGAGAADKTVNEAQVALSDSFRHDAADYFPIYELHSNQKGTVPLPEDTSGFFMEYNIIDWVYQNRVHNLYTLPVGELVRIIAERSVDASYLETARRNHFPIAFGDIVINPYEALSLIKITSKEDTEKFWRGIYIIAGSFLPEATRLALAAKVPQMSRRQFLTLSVAGLGALAGSWLSSKTKYFEDKTIIKAVETDPFNRFLLRLYGLSSTLHPEDSFLFVRNVTQALKIKALAGFAKKTNPHPLIPFDTGAMHGGTEDFIPLPDDLLRHLIAYTDRFYMGKVVRKYGPELVATTRLIVADETGIFRDLPSLVDKKLLSLLTEIKNMPLPTPKPALDVPYDR